MAIEDKCIYCLKRPQSSDDMDTCRTCRAWMHRRIKQTVKQIFEYADQQRTLSARLSAIASIDGTKVERADKQELVDRGLMCFAGLKRRSISATTKRERLKARAAAALVQIKHRDKRRLSGPRQHSAAHA